MDYRKLTDTIAVAPQVDPADLKMIADLGYTTVINNRPDGETPDQPLSAEVEAAAEAAGLTYIHMPVISGQVTDQDANAFGAALDEAKGPVFAFCRTGTRCACLWALATAGEIGADGVLNITADAGYQLEALRPRLSR